jgi:Nucleotidyltransferase domain
MHIYAFGSVCRGDISLGSDIDLLAIVEGHNSQIDPDTFSIYSYRRIHELWQEGNPFAWHLFLEARLIYTSDLTDYLKLLGSPETYKKCLHDCEKFSSLFQEAHSSIIEGSNSMIFDFSVVFLSIRNIATCFSLGVIGQPNFSRNSALCLGFDSIPIGLDLYHILERARILCTRGYGEKLTNDDIETIIQELNKIRKWIDNLVVKAKANE